MNAEMIAVGVPKFCTYIDCAGVNHHFVFNLTAIKDGVGCIIEAREIDPVKAPGYSFSSAPSFSPAYAMGEINQKIEAELSRKYLYLNGESVSLHANEVAGVIAGNGFIVDGMHLTSEQFVTLIQTREGACFSLKISE